MLQKSYISRSKSLTKSFDRAVKLVHPFLSARYGSESLELIEDARKCYINLIPQIPYIGESNPMIDLFYLPATRHLAVYRAFKQHAKSLEEAGRVIYEIGEAELRSIPWLIRKVIGFVWFTGIFKGRLKKRAISSDSNNYPGCYRVSYSEGDRNRYDYRFDYHQCAVLHFFQNQGAAEIVPYICAIDRPASELLGWGLDRTTTLAEGGKVCDFKFKKGGPTSVQIPRSLCG